VRVPRPHLELSTSEVLVSEFLDGETLADGARPADAGRAARALIAAVRAATLETGLAPVDLRASHVVVGPRDDLGLLGLGTSRAIDRERARRALDGLGALAGHDADAFAERIAATGVLSAEDAAAAHPVLREVAGALLDGPATLDAEALRDTGVRAWRAAPRLAQLATAASPHPQDLTLGRTLGQLVAVLARLGAREDWAAIIKA
jgi:predicted unusual protein kinase regulating ubiquinone biosynthesis (AarF/ABC1/UbiB family)